eukprot:TRINITY_DN8829_c0_g1_i2.p1 TRINITY_DN8829_c0_g1~~TRINITY_DN8829_c0_g1_i2.p1  ORF type:complete len:206 (-),score=38.36 TRINITY_DN8829_c0_g1_i2:114-731(-)
MSKKGELERLAKGVYCRPKVTRFGKISAGEENILNYYIGKENYTGVVIGYRLYNKYGITTQVSKSVKIYSNVLEEEKKVIKNVEIKKVNISIDSKIKRAIEQLEILENYDEIEDIDKNSLIRLYRTIAEEYSDKVFITVLRNIKYKKKELLLIQKVFQITEEQKILFLNFQIKHQNIKYQQWRSFMNLHTNKEDFEDLCLSLIHI